MRYVQQGGFLISMDGIRDVFIGIMPILAIKLKVMATATRITLAVVLIWPFGI
jgi:hypothetical protein